jgi:uncharacterized protein
MATQEHPNAKVVREGMDAMQRGDAQWMQDHLSDDVVWHVGGNSRSAGDIRGKDSVLQYFGAMGEGSAELDVHDIIANDDHAVVLGTARLTAPDGDSVEYRFVNVFHIQDGKTTEAWGMAENDAVSDPFFDKLAASQGA